MGMIKTGMVRLISETASWNVKNRNRVDSPQRQHNGTSKTGTD
jgi:hypothetical protein